MNKSYVLCEYRDWAFDVARGILDVEGWEPSLLITTEDSICDLNDFERKNIPILRINPKTELKKGGVASKAIEEIQPDAIFFNSWSWIVPKNILNQCPCITQHPGKLPLDRGGSPIQNQIRNGEKWTYANMMMMGEGLDEGPIYLRKKFGLEGTINEVMTRMTATSSLIGRDCLRMIGNGQKPIEQSNENSSFYNRVTSESAEIIQDTNLSVTQIYDIIRAHNELDKNSYVMPAYILTGNKKVLLLNAEDPSKCENRGGIDLLKVKELESVKKQICDGELTVYVQNEKGNRVYITEFEIVGAKDPNKNLSLAYETSFKKYTCDIRDEIDIERISEVLEKNRQSILSQNRIELQSETRTLVAKQYKTQPKYGMEVINLDKNLMKEEKIFNIAHIVNNGDASLRISDKKGKGLYLSSFFISSLKNNE